MADRTNPETNPVINGADDSIAVAQTAAMDAQPFNNAVRAVMLGQDFVAFREFGGVECERLGVVARPKHAVTDLPNGTSSFDSQSIFAWMRRVLPGDKTAVAQVRALTATAIARVR